MGRQVALEDRLEFGKPGGMGRPRWAGDEVAVGDGVGDFDGGIGAAGVFYFRGAGGIGAKALAFYDARGSENLRAMAERGDGLIGFGEMADEFEDFWFGAEIFGSAAAGDYQRVVIFGMDVGESGVEREIVAGLFGVSLIAFEIVDGGADGLAGLFVGADGVDGVAEHLQGLEWDHNFVVFDVIAYEH